MAVLQALPAADGRLQSADHGRYRTQVALKMARTTLLALALLVTTLSPVAALHNGLARLPPCVTPTQRPAPPQPTPASARSAACPARWQPLSCMTLPVNTAWAGGPGRRFTAPSTRRR